MLSTKQPNIFFLWDDSSGNQIPTDDPPAYLVVKIEDIQKLYLAPIPSQNNTQLAQLSFTICDNYDDTIHAIDPPLSGFHFRVQEITDVALFLLFKGNGVDNDDTSYVRQIDVTLQTALHTYGSYNITVKKTDTVNYEALLSNKHIGYFFELLQALSNEYKRLKNTERTVSATIELAFASLSPEWKNFYEPSDFVVMLQQATSFTQELLADTFKRERAFGICLKEVLVVELYQLAFEDCIEAQYPALYQALDKKDFNTAIQQAKEMSCPYQRNYVLDNIFVCCQQQGNLEVVAEFNLLFSDCYPRKEIIVEHISNINASNEAC